MAKGGGRVERALEDFHARKRALDWEGRKRKVIKGKRSRGKDLKHHGRAEEGNQGDGKLCFRDL